MEKRLYRERKLLIQPIDKPEKINIFNHTILFINEEDTSIERAIPDFEEKYMDSDSSNISKINENTYLSYFQIIDEKSSFLPSDRPIFEVTIFEGQADDPTKYIGPKIVGSRCLNCYSSTIEDYILDSKQVAKRKIMQ